MTWNDIHIIIGWHYTLGTLGTTQALMIKMLDTSHVTTLYAYIFSVRPCLAISGAGPTGVAALETCSPICTLWPAEVTG